MINWIPACETCPTCLSGRQNLCERLPATTFKALLLDGTSRLRSDDGLMLKHYLSSATMAEYAWPQCSGPLGLGAKRVTIIA